MFPSRPRRPRRSLDRLLARLDALPPAVSWVVGLLTGAAVILAVGPSSTLWVALFVLLLAFVAVRGAGLWSGSQRAKRGAVGWGVLASMGLALGMVVIVALLSRWIPDHSPRDDEDEALGTLKLDLGYEPEIDDSTGSDGTGGTGGTDATDTANATDDDPSTGTTDANPYALPIDDTTGSALDPEPDPLASNGSIPIREQSHGDTGPSVAVPPIPPEPCRPGMVLIKGGRSGRTRIRDFCLDITEVTTGSYKRCLKAGERGDRGCQDGGKRVVAKAKPEDEKGAWEDKCNLNQNRSSHPVNCVNWEQAHDYCRWVGKRLPTDQEWVWAARGSQEKRRFPWGNELPSCDVTVMSGCSSTGTKAVGTTPGDATPAGVMDMGGNLEEWTATKDKDGRQQVLRGGSGYFSGSDRFKISNKQGGLPNVSFIYVGFRCAANPRKNATDAE